MMEEKITILVIDDERVVRDGCSRVLGGKGYRVLTAENGMQGMEILEEESIDVILLDLKMPIMGGEEMLEKINERYPDIPVIIITGHGTIDKAVECMKKGAYDFITKPFQIDQFLHTIYRAAERRALALKTLLYEQEKSRNLYDLNLERSRLRTIINCIPNGVMVTDRNLDVVLHNPALVRLLNIKESVPNPAPLDKIISNGQLIATLKGIVEGKISSDEIISQEIEVEKNHIRAISSPALAPDGKIVGTVTVLEDITPFKRLDEMKSDFINMVAHALKSPLSAIKQQHNVLVEGLAGELNSKQKELLEKASKRIDSLLELIKDLLDMAKIEAGKAIQRQVNLDIAPIVKEIVELMLEKARSQGVELSYSMEDVGPIKADPKGIEEILNNLITNAINYSPDGGRVHVSIKGMEEFLEIRVSDTGIGILPEEIPKIFDKFYRVKHPKTRQVMGTGLGLSIVKAIVDSHHGSIDVESVPGKGTTFKVLLPAIREEGRQDHMEGRNVI